MRVRTITRVVDALAAQQRIILWLDCKHTVTISAIAAHEMTRHEVDGMRVGAHWDCPHCPDAPPPEPTIRARRMAAEYDATGD